MPSPDRRRFLSSAVLGGSAVASPAYRQVGALLKSGPRETWDEEDMRVLCYTAEYDGTAATAVFAVPLRHYRPEDVRVALVDESTESTLLVSA